MRRSHSGRRASALHLLTGSPTALLLAALVCSGVVVGGAGFALSAAKGPAAPTITTKPASSTSSASATFAFNGASGSSFQCKLDASAFSLCSSPKSYSSLPQGTHVFQVKAIAGGQESTPTSYSWTIDTTPPSPPTLSSKPTSLSSSTSPTFAFTSSEAGVQFRCMLDGGAQTACASPKTYSGLVEGAHSFAVQAVDAAGNTSTASSWSWTIDSTPPAAPVITQKPADPTANATNTFAWTSPPSAVAFQCSLENGAWRTCATPYTFVIDTRANEQHQFALRALDSAGNASSPATYKYKYDKLQPTAGVPFRITGFATGLTMGLWRPVEVTLHNPNTAAIYVSGVTVSAAADSTPAGCSSAANLEIEQSDISSTGEVLVPAGASVTLPTQGASTPRIRLKNLPDVNQDICKNKSFALSYSGTAHN